MIISTVSLKDKMVRLVCALLLLAVATASASESRIVGGIETTVEEYPSVLQVQRSVTEIWRQHCAGSILTSRFFLTAATCVMGPSFMVRLRRVIAGSSIRNVGGQVSPVARIIQHPSWHEGLNFDGDIAVVELQIPLQFTAVVQQATIIGQGAFIPDNMPSVQVGWGFTLNEEFPSLFSTPLQKVNVLTVNRERCAIVFDDLPLPVTVSENMICAASIADGGACIGDRGGPLYINDIVVGVVSRAWGCGNSTVATVHSAVPSFTNWILATAV